MAFANERQIWYDEGKKVSVTFADVTQAAQDLANGHLSGPVSAHFLSKALAAAALLGSEMEEKDETVIIQIKCDGPIGGITAECTAAGTLRGYAEKKILDGLDGMGAPDPKKAIGRMQLQVTRSVPGRIISRGISNSIDGYLAGSLQRKAVIVTDAAVTDDVKVLSARGVMVEALPDSDASLADLMDPEKKPNLSVAPSTFLKKLGLAGARLKKTDPLSFACRCSPDRAAAMLAALSEDERSSLPPSVDITCHMCGKTWTVKTK
ncbi:MAG: Hsp33 family molecular chaperone HslO [Kiritimatiellae bacterium]|nr:Hsp33 family molecular chaperone HslO [Kiritimatiellia bacterium]